MFFRHVKRTFKTKWSTLLLLGVIIFLSSFIYSVISSAVAGLSVPADRFFSETNQEDVAIEVTPYLDNTIYPCVPDGIDTMAQLYAHDRVCYDEVMQLQLTFLRHTFSDMAFEIRYYKDAQIQIDGSHHQLRVLKEMETINLALMEAGAKPEHANEIAIGGLYAKNNQLSLGDTIHVLGEAYIITGFVLFPDYNLPIIDHPFLFDSYYQTVGFMSNQAFEALHAYPEYTIAGTFETPDSKANFIATFETYEGFHYATYLLTENNIRSGAIYGEIAGGTAMGIFLSVMIALIGIIIVSMVMSKTLNKERSAIGVLKALGVKDSEIRNPYLIFLIIFSFSFLALGYGVGFYFSPHLRDVFLTFYLLPKDPIPFSLIDVFVAIFIPFIIITGLSWWIIAKLLKEDAVHLLQPKMMHMKPVKFKKLQTAFDKLDVLTRFQFKHLIRHPAKIFAYVIGIFLALYSVLIGFSMINVFDRTLNDYYASIEVSHIGYCELFEPCDVGNGEPVIEVNALIKGEQSMMIGLDADSRLHPLADRRGQDLMPSLTRGLVITKSFQDLTRVRVGDTVMVEILHRRFEVEVVAVADLYPGAYVFYDRAMLGEMLTEDSDFFNVVYSDGALDEDAFVKVLQTTAILEQSDYMNDIMQVMMYVIIAGAFLIGLIVIYLLSVLTVEDQFYNISLLKVVGYEDKEIHKMMLGGYFKLNLVIFILCLPFTILSTVVMKLVFIEYYGFMMPLQISVWHVFLTAVAFMGLFYLGSLRAKEKVNRIALQEALKVYQS